MTLLLFFLIYTFAIGVLAVLLALPFNRKREFDEEVKKKFVEDPKEWERILKEKGFRK